MIQRELSAIEVLERVLKDRKAALKAAQHQEAKSPSIKAVGINCTGCGKFLLIEGISPGLDRFAVCECSKRFGAGWGADGILSAYPA
jgi:hypothetical protein